jgi:hypothetical protein
MPRTLKAGSGLIGPLLLARPDLGRLNSILPSTCFVSLWDTSGRPTRRRFLKSIRLLVLASAALAEVDGAGDGNLRDLLRGPRGRGTPGSLVAPDEEYATTTSRNAPHRDQS